MFLINNNNGEILDYTGKGFYLDSYEEYDLKFMLDNIHYFNGIQMEVMLNAELVVDGGNKVNLYKGDKKILSCVTIREARMAVAAIIGYVLD